MRRFVESSSLASLLADHEMHDGDSNGDDETGPARAALSRMRSRYPELFERGELSLDALERRLGEDERAPAGGSTFTTGEEAPAEDSEHRRGPELCLPCPSRVNLVARRSLSRRWDDTRNVLVQGDNLAALSALKADLWEALDMVYLDPPYNTGNAFIYSDRDHGGDARVSGPNNRGAAVPKDQRNGWVQMLAPRLIAARGLLKPTGFLCVSIDDHEVHTMRTLLDETFGPSNRIETIIVSMNAKGRQLAPHFALAHEYVLIYARDIRQCAIRAGLPEAVDPADFPLEDSEGHYRLLPLRNTNKKFNPDTRPNLAYPLFVDRETGEVDVASGEDTIRIMPVFGTGAPAVWRWSKGKVAEERTRLFGRQVRGKTGRRWDVFQKDYNHAGRTKKLTSVWLSKDIGTTDAAARELKARGVGAFDTPKPLALMRRLCALTPPDARVADLFAGSGTTGEAVLQLNVEYGAQRSFVLIQNEEGTPSSESNIAELTRVRLSAACDALEDLTSGGDVGATVDLGFRVYRCEKL